MAKLTRELLNICFVLGVGGYTYGYCFACFVTILGQPGFYNELQLDPTSTYTANVIGAANAVFTAAAAAGAIAQGFISDWLGRKGGLAVSGVLATLGGALSAGSVNLPMIICVRLIQGAGAGMVICLVPLYLAETAPPQNRGFLSGLTVLAFGFGYEACAAISIGSYFAKNSALQWRLPLALSCIGPLVLLCCLPLIPESPRFLIWKGKNEEANTILRRLHRDPHDPTDAMAVAEYVQITQQVELDKETRATFWDIFKRPSWRKRAILVLFLLFASQSTGILAIANFLVIIMGGLGFTGVMPLVMFFIWSCTGTVGVIISIWIVDRVGRRLLLITGYAALSLILLSEALLERSYLNQTPANKPGLAACLVFLFCYILAYQAVDAPSFIFATEIWPTTLRAKGCSLMFFAYFVGAITYTTPGALMIQRISWRLYLLYAGLCAISGVIVFFFIPETKGLPMEEIASLFGDRVVVRLTDDGQGILKDSSAQEIEMAPGPREIDSKGGSKRNSPIRQVEVMA